MRCGECCFYDRINGWCHRFPNIVKSQPDDWCGEYIRGPNRQDVAKFVDNKNRITDKV